MPLTLRGSNGSFGYGGTSRTVTFPTVVAGDLLVAIHHCQGAGSVGGGLTQVVSGSYGKIGWKIADGTETTYTMTSSTSGWSWATASFSGFDAGRWMAYQKGSSANKTVTNPLPATDIIRNQGVIDFTATPIYTVTLAGEGAPGSESYTITGAPAGSTLAGSIQTYTGNGASASTGIAYKAGDLGGTSWSGASFGSTQLALVFYGPEAVAGGDGFGFIF